MEIMLNIISVISLIITFVVYFHGRWNQKQHHKKLWEAKNKKDMKVEINTSILYDENLANDFVVLPLFICIGSLITSGLLNSELNKIIIYIVMTITIIVLIIIAVPRVLKGLKNLLLILTRTYKVTTTRILKKEVREVNGKKELCLEFDNKECSYVDYETHQAVNEGDEFYFIKIGTIAKAFDRRFYKIKGSE